MNELNKYENEEIELKNNLVRIGDFVNMDGPMLVLFKHKGNDEFYLFDWVDNDEKSNRWLIYQVDKGDLIAFVQKRISYRKLFEENLVEIYFSDIENKKLFQYNIYRLKELPDSYRPDRDILFDEGDSKQLDKILAELNINTLLNDKKVKEYNFIFDSGIVVIFESQNNFLHPKWPENINKLTNIIPFIEAQQTNVAKSNSISGQKSMVLQ